MPVPATVVMTPARRHLADHVVARVGDEQVAGESTATPVGSLSVRPVAGPPSPV